MTYERAWIVANQVQADLEKSRMTAELLLALEKDHNGVALPNKPYIS